MRDAAGADLLACARPALEGGKHRLVEKPIGLDAAQAAEIVEVTAGETVSHSVRPVHRERRLPDARHPGESRDHHGPAAFGRGFPQQGVQDRQLFSSAGEVGDVRR
ncbi:hypothetical protein F9278_45310 [Streptomyces phaeolivaceus]|uniref:Uncharacterized protein n=1 Tax=Streptomyces phaeolivaceus TaxID=2653200 RepID=A0A5P8KI23_9ACTN|nr:hypothetical protein F9278_45310 [Streptomyces phaeolivaceus]